MISQFLVKNQTLNLTLVVQQKRRALLEISSCSVWIQISAQRRRSWIYSLLIHNNLRKEKLRNAILASFSYTL